MSTSEQNIQPRVPVPYDRPPRLILADEHELLLDGLKSLMENHFDVVAIVKDGQATVAAAEHLRPDAVLMDIGLPLLNGIAVARHIRRTLPQTKILFMARHAEPVYVEEAFREGVAGYVLKQAPSAELFEAISSVLTGKKYLSPGIGIRIDKLEIHPVNRRTAGGLTERQREVLQLVAEGKAMKEIAWLLRISIRTVEFHKQALFQDLGVRTTAELIRYALDQKIVV
jgi:DNA-binding NarL/FixJ family response regulator